MDFYYTLTCGYQKRESENMSDVTIAYFPVIGRGEQIRIACAMHGIAVNELASTPLGEDFDKDKEAPFGTVPWMKDHSNGIELNDSLAIIQYLVSKYEGPLTPKSTEDAAMAAMYWGWVQDYYSFVLSPMHDIITGHNEVFWRNLRLTDTLAEGGKDTAIANLASLHRARLAFLETHLNTQSAGPFLNGKQYSYADIFLYTCVRTVEETPGFGMLRAVVGDTPFADYPTVESIAAAVGVIDIVKATVGTKFSECPI